MNVLSYYIEVRLYHIIILLDFVKSVDAKQNRVWS